MFIVDQIVKDFKCGHTFSRELLQSFFRARNCSHMDDLQQKQNREKSPQHILKVTGNDEGVRFLLAPLSYEVFSYHTRSFHIVRGLDSH